MSTSQTIAISGGTGFIGRHLIKILLARGYYVNALCRHLPKKTMQTDMAGLENVAPSLQKGSLRWIQGDITSQENWQEWLTGANIVVHLAGLTTARRRSLYYKCNAKPLGKLAQAAQKAGVKHFIFLSSLTARAPELSNYASSKHAGELALQAACKQIKINPLIIRAPAVFGVGDKATQPFYRAIRAGFLPVPGGKYWKKRTLSLIDAEDLSAYIADLVGDMPQGGGIFYPANIARLSWLCFGVLATRASGRRIRILLLPPVLLYMLALLTNISKFIFNKGHLTTPKLRELLYANWAVDEEPNVVERPLDLVFALAKPIYHDTIV